MNRTMLAQFSENYSKISKRTDNLIDKITRSYFFGSKILVDDEDKMRAILYLNLPY
jgi:hypothetical protein